MIWIPVLGLSFAAFLLQLFFLRECRKYPGVANLTGCEIARRLLDMKGFSQVAVEEVSGRNRFKSPKVNQLCLDAEIYRGKNLAAIARAARGACLMMKVKSLTIPLDARMLLWALFRYLILGGWAVLVVNQFYLLFIGGTQAAITIFTVIFVVAVASLPSEWEASDQAFSLLKESDALRADELARIKNILRAERIHQLAYIFRAPFDFLYPMLATPRKK